jgi:hypothetical protein
MRLPVWGYHHWWIERFQRFGCYSCIGDGPVVAGMRGQANRRWRSLREPTTHRPHDERPYQPPQCVRRSGEAGPSCRSRPGTSRAEGATASSWPPITVRDGDGSIKAGGAEPVICSRRSHPRDREAGVLPLLHPARSQWPDSRCVPHRGASPADSSPDSSRASSRRRYGGNRVSSLPASVTDRSWRT